MTSIKVGTSMLGVSDIPVEPDTVQYGLQDISASDAGRVQDSGNTMYKNRVSQKRKLSLGWTNPTVAQASAILQAFNPEYVFVRYLDLLAGAYQTREFYVGDRSAPYRQVTLAGGGTVSTLSFDIIER